jgi:hypothetical protein
VAVDLAAVFDVAGARLDELVGTSGTVVDLLRGGDPAAALVDPVTLAPTTTPAVAYAVARPALVGELAGPTDGLPARPVNPGDAMIVLTRSGGVLPDVRDRDVVAVAECRDARLVGRRYLVREVRGGTAGVALLVSGSLVRP